MMGVGY